MQKSFRYIQRDDICDWFIKQQTLVINDFFFSFFFFRSVLVLHEG